MGRSLAKRVINPTGGVGRDPIGSWRINLVTNLITPPPVTMATWFTVVGRVAQIESILDSFTCSLPSHPGRSRAENGEAFLSSKLRSGVKYILMINYPKKAPGKRTGRLPYYGDESRPTSDPRSG